MKDFKRSAPRAEWSAPSGEWCGKAALLIGAIDDKHHYDNFLGRESSGQTKNDQTVEDSMFKDKNQLF